MQNSKFFINFVYKLKDKDNYEKGTKIIMERTDKKSLEFVSTYMKEHYEWIESVTYPETEDFNIDLTLTTTNGDVYGVEVKTYRNRNLLNEDGSINEYFRIGNHMGGMYRDCYWSPLPNKDNSINSIRKVKVSDIRIDTTKIVAPQDIDGKYCQCLNASTTGYYDGLRLVPNGCKFSKVYLKGDVILIFLAHDGMIIFTPKQLKEAFLGYTWMYCKHTQDFKENEKGFELKALFDMTKATMIKCNVPDDIFKV